MPTVIPSLAGSTVHEANIELYQRHRNDGTNRCAACGHPIPCRVAHQAAQVICTAGEDPHWYDGQLVAQSAAPYAQPVIQPSPITTREIIGYPVGGHGRRAIVPSTPYER